MEDSVIGYDTNIEFHIGLGILQSHLGIPIIRFID